MSIRLNALARDTVLNAWRGLSQRLPDDVDLAAVASLQEPPELLLASAGARVLRGGGGGGAALEEVSSGSSRPKAVPAHAAQRRGMPTSISELAATTAG